MTFEDFMNEDPLRRYQREAAEQEAEFARQRRREEREWQRTQRVSTVRVPDDLQIFIAPRDWMDAQTATLRRAISEGDAAVLDAVNEAIIPCIEKIADKVRKIEELTRTVEGLQSELSKLRSAAKHAEPIDLPRIPLRSRRDVRVN
jgi:hypothetical protein